MRKSKTRYTTGEFAKYFGIKKDTLFYYDKIKLFCPAGICENGYRYYTAEQIEPFWTLLTLRELNVPIKVLQDYFNKPSPEQLNKIACAQLVHVKEEIEKLQRIEKLLVQISNSVHEAENAVFGKVIIENVSDKRFIYSRQTSADTETTFQQWNEIYDEFVTKSDLMGESYVGSVISKEDLENGLFGRVDRLFALSTGKGGKIRHGGQYAVYYHKGNYDSIQTAYPNILNEIRKLGYTIAGAAYEEYLIAETATNCKDEYITKISIEVVNLN